MIYYIADFPAEIDSLEKDPVFNTIKNFELGQFDYRVLIPQFVPFLRYLAAEYGLYDSDRIVRVFDELQDVHQQQGFPLTLTDLVLPPKTEQVYTRQQVLLTRDGQQFGSVSFNRFGFVKQVETTKDDVKRTDVYSDRGFISYSKFHNLQTNDEQKIYYNRSRRHPSSILEGPN